MSFRDSRSRRAGRRLAVNAEISVTSLVDVAFTLLVIFIITAPILQGGIEVNVPETTVRPLTAEEESSIITVTADGRVFLAESEMSVEQFERSIGSLVEAGQWERLYIKGDSASEYDAVAKVIGAVNASGANWSLIMEQRPNR